MYFEIYKSGKLIKRSDEVLDGLSWDNELMYTPSLSLKLPITYLDFLSGREEVKVFVNDKCFWGIVVGLQANKDDETLDVDLEHVITEWNYRQISVNNAIKSKKINIIYKEEDKTKTEPTVQDQLDDIYSDTNFAFPGWTLNMSDHAADTEIDYVYSRQSKLEALDKTMELTPDLFWRVRFVNEKVIDISEMGEKKQWIISTKPTGVNNISLVEEPQIEFVFDDVVNLATVYSETSDSGMSSLTLREVYNDPDLQKDGFPCVILRDNVNNERDYSKYTKQYPRLAPNNELEYAVIDEVSVALEGGTVIEGTYAFNDLSPFEVESKSGETKEISDADRIKAAKTAYHAAIRKLKQARRRTEIRVTTEQLPAEIAPGDRVRLIYTNIVYLLDACSNYEKKILTYDDWFYVTKISYDIENGVETDELTLEKYLHIDREVY